jgi:3-oxoacyl-[acyl-carrier protein] reductase
VTGASSGIGRALTELLASKGIRGCPRRERLAVLAEALERRWGGSARPIVADLADPAAVEHIAAELERRSTHVDVLINNSGPWRSVRRNDVG